MVGSLCSDGRKGEKEGKQAEEIREGSMSARLSSF
jgi:hypothetical protein